MATISRTATAYGLTMQPTRWPSRWLAQNTFTRSARAKIIAGVDLISDALPLGRLWYAEPNAVGNAVDYGKFYGAEPRGRWFSPT